MAAPRSRFAQRLLYAGGVAALGGSILYISYRPRNIPGSEPAAVPPRFAPDGTVAPPRFPSVKSRVDQIADLKKSAVITQSVLDKSKSAFSGLLGAKEETQEVKEPDPYDLLIIGGGATGTGIALDAATRGLKVAVVERDDFSSGTSSKSTKLVHGGVRYLEKAVFELDYDQ